ncbi:hypothetical protein BofuT4_P043120.1 [Botrytis cinerea T4]|uniref:Uncharacterized protein n=1 Tax=Botryotinia fuckeliana (strain T4) TaxID=999810 RepID=G2Y211_BOTF4|nr:hypothetical protein BofuT4_P043120.1 [Botrytis cinerea T4]
MSMAPRENFDHPFSQKPTQPCRRLDAKWKHTPKFPRKSKVSIGRSWYDGK